MQGEAKMLSFEFCENSFEFSTNFFLFEKRNHGEQCVTEFHKKNISDAMKNQKSSPEQRKKMIQTLKKLHEDENSDNLDLENENFVNDKNSSIFDDENLQNFAQLALSLSHFWEKFL